MANFKNKFGRGGLFEFLKSTTKLIIYGVVLFSFLFANLDYIMMFPQMGAGLLIRDMVMMLLELIGVVCLITGLIAVVDTLFQRREHARKNRMSLQEYKDEMKEGEGDQSLKQERRQRGQRIALNQMLKDVPGADVVIVNPTHYAVALKWSRLPGEAPVCIAKGVDEIALQIRELAHEHAVPIHHDAPTARGIFAAVDVGQQISPDHFKPVAAAIRFAENMRMRAKSRWL